MLIRCRDTRRRRRQCLAGQTAPARTLGTLQKQGIATRSTHARFDDTFMDAPVFISTHALARLTVYSPVTLTALHPFTGLICLVAFSLPPPNQQSSCLRLVLRALFHAPRSRHWLVCHLPMTMLDLRVVGVVGAIIIGLLGPLQASEPWSRAVVVRNWDVSSTGDRWRVSLSIAYFTFHLLAVLVLVYLWLRSPSSQLSLGLGLLECSWLNGLSIQVRIDVCCTTTRLTRGQILTFLRIVQQAQSVRGPFCAICASTVALHLAGFACSFHYREVGRLVLVLGGSVFPLCLFGFYAYFTLRRSAVGLRITLFGLFTGLTLLANLLAIKLDSIDKILEVCGQQRYYNETNRKRCKFSWPALPALHLYFLGRRG